MAPPGSDGTVFPAFGWRGYCARWLALAPTWNALTNGGVITGPAAEFVHEVLGDKVLAVCRVRDAIQILVWPTGGAISFLPTLRFSPAPIRL
jgi:hypothetical protein